MRRIVSDSETRSANCEPDVQQWSQLLRENRQGTERSEAEIRLRAEVVDAAQRFTCRLHDTARAARVPMSCDAIELSYEADTPIVMTGHQPTIFHPGIVAKYDVTAKFARHEQGIAIAVIIDTDAGDAGEMLVPQYNDATVRLDRESISVGHELFLNQRIAEDTHLRDVAMRVRAELIESGFSEAASNTQIAIDRYRQLAGCSIVEANAIMRRSLGIASGCLEVPLSDILALSECQRFFGEILADSRRFREIYNRTLDTHRQQRKIRNQANPFPNLREYAPAVELPFWIIDRSTGERAALFVEDAGQTLRLSTRHGSVTEIPRAKIYQFAEHLRPDLMMAPRGPLITSLFRLVLSDLFVHGTGGGKYDRFTDELIRDYWAVEPPAFTVATRKQYLFERQREEAARLLAFGMELRSMPSHAERYFGNETFSPEAEQQLRELVATRKQHLDSLKQAKQNHLPAADIGRVLKQLDERIAAVIRQDLAERITSLEQLTPALLRTYDSREFPFFFFPHLLAVNGIDAERPITLALCGASA